jgi:hypothetical protein
MPLPPALESLMRAIPPLGGAGRTAPGADLLAAGAGGALSPSGPAGPGARPAAGPGGVDPFTSVVNQRLAESSGADPQYFLDQLTQMKKIVSAMLPKALQRFPGQTDRQLQNLLRAIDATAKTFQEAAQHAAAMSGAGGGAGPIDFAGANIGQPATMPVGI